MKPRVHIITLGVSNIVASKNFYCDLFGWEVSSASNESVVFFKSPGVTLGLYPRKALAEDAQLKDEGSGFSGVTLAHNVTEKSSVAPLLEKALKCGGRILKPAQDVFWGGHSGYFADPDGHLWEVAWNPHFTFDSDGGLALP